MKRITWVECPNCKKCGDQKVVRSERNSKFIIIRTRKCKECGQHNANLLDSVCFECREYEYQMNLGE